MYSEYLWAVRHANLFNMLPPDRRLFKFAMTTLEHTPLFLHHAPLLHELYQAAPHYFDLLGTRVPNFTDVQHDIGLALQDPRRHMELLHDSEGHLVGSLDYKMDYPQAGDVTINLLLIREDRQNQHLGEQAVKQLEARLPQGTQRILASVLGENPRGVRFWERLGYIFTLDARPVMSWYAKQLSLPTLGDPLPPMGVASD